jgi:hypothetical protein
MGKNRVAAIPQNPVSREVMGDGGISTKRVLRHRDYAIAGLNEYRAQRERGSVAGDAALRLGHRIC